MKASNFVYEGEAGGEVWMGKRSGKDNGVPKEKKARWAKYFTKKMIKQNFYYRKNGGLFYID